MKRESSRRVEVDDLWLASFLVAGGARLAAIAVLPYSNRRLTAVFELEEVAETAIAEYAEGAPLVNVHDLREALNRLRDGMHRELSRKNGKPQMKEMPNARRSDGQRRVIENEDRERADRAAVRPGGSRDQWE